MDEKKEKKAREEQQRLVYYRIRRADGTEEADIVTEKRFGRISAGLKIVSDETGADGGRMVTLTEKA